MHTLRLSFLIGLMFSLMGGSAAHAEPSTSPVSALAGCDITLKGHHGGSSGTIVFDFNLSEVKNKTGWWDELGVGKYGYDRLSLNPGNLFSEVFSRDFSCNAQRQYRLFLVATVEGRRYEYVHYYPAQGDHTRETVIDLGDVSRFFDAIEPGPPIVSDTPASLSPGSPMSPVAGLDLEGEWIRRESNYGPNDGMRIAVSGGQAVLTFVPTTGHIEFHEGEVIWQNIEPGGTLRVLGSDDNYYSAQMKAEGSDRLHIDIRHNGPGNDQTWDRGARASSSDDPEDCWAEGIAASNGNPQPDIWVRSSPEMSEGVRIALRAARDARAEIQTFALTLDGEWVVVAANTPCYSAGFPEGARSAIDGYIAQGSEVDVVAFGPGGRWLVVAEDLIRRSNNVSTEIRDEIRRAQGQGRRLTSFAFSEDPDEGWIFTAGGVGYRGQAASPSIWAAIASALQGDRPVHHVAITPDGAWLVLAEDWYASRGLPADLLAQMERYRTDNERRIDQIALHPAGDRTAWAIVSNVAEPRPMAGDLINQFEHGLPGDSSVYQRMKRHRITGLSIAVVQNNDVAWARGYGRTEFEAPENYVYPNTIFDAASISKALTGAAVLQLVDDDKLGLLDTGVLNELANDELPGVGSLNTIRSSQIHLAHLMRHCAGLDHANGSSGAQPITLGDPLPTLADMFLGRSPADTTRRIVPIDNVMVGEDFDYSGANSLLIQALIEHHADGGYDDQMNRLLDDLNMRRSSYRTALRSLREYFARGHSLSQTGSIQMNEILVYPNQAAANLRTTALDLAQFVIMLTQEGIYKDQTILDPSTFEQFVGWDGIGSPTGIAEQACAENATMQLHIRSDNLGSPSNKLVYHGGLHNGYLTFMYALPDRDAGVVILITGDWDGTLRWASDAGAFSTEIRDALEAIYGWPNLN